MWPCRSPGETAYDTWLRFGNMTLPLLPGESGPNPVVPVVNSLGSGSDHTAFYAHAGISALQAGVTPPSNNYYSVYHSVYDSYDWITNFGDPTYVYHAMMSQVLGTMAINFATDLVRMRVCGVRSKQNTFFPGAWIRPHVQRASDAGVRRGISCACVTVRRHGWPTGAWVNP